MPKRNILTLIFGSCAVLILILDSKTAISGIQSGLDICIRTLIPSLFPFLFLSGLITGSLSGTKFRIFRPLETYCRIPPSCGSILPISWLSGYPVGAGNVSKLQKEGNLTEKDATRLAVLCNNAGPAFLFGIISPFFSGKLTVFILWGIHLISAILAAAVLPGAQSPDKPLSETKPLSFSRLMGDSIKTMASVCGCVTLFRMILEFLNRWIFWLLPQTLQVPVTGMLELANGCLMLDRIGNESIRFITVSGLLSFGGICVLLQTLSVFPHVHLKTYLWGKTVQTCWSLLLSASYVSWNNNNPLPALITAVMISTSLMIPKHMSRTGQKKEVAF